jgi:transcription elongation factor Elf1
MLYIDAKFVGSISYKLRNFKKKADYYWNFSCPICGDSKKNPLKARGFVFKNQQRLVYKCHNCGFSSNIGNLIKHLDPMLYNEYVLERYKENTSKHNDHVNITNVLPELLNEQSTKLSQDLVAAGAKSVALLPSDHPAVEYVTKRMIPQERFKDIYFVPKFKEFVNKIKFQYTKTDNDTPRLIIPFFDKDDKCIAFQGRAFGNEIPKYVTIKLDDTQEKIYGLDRMDPDKRIYVTEGPIDSMFIPNAIAVAGAGFDTKFINAIKDNATLIMDNEPRSKEICKFIEKLIDQEYSICLWPDTVAEKDINEMVMNGKPISQIIETINNNTFSGMQAKLKFTTWKKC